MSRSNNPFLKRAPDPSESKPAGDEDLLEISQRLDQFQLEGSVTMDNGAPIFAWAADQPNRKGATACGSSRVAIEPNLLHNQITTGRDTNLNLSSSAYNVSGNLIQVVNNNYEGTVKESTSGSSERRRNNLDDDINDDVAAGMMIPAPPSCILERDSQHDQIVANLLSTPNAKVAILGMGGIGKTSLACSVASDPEIVEAYSRRLFLSFEGCSTPDLAYTNIAIAFGVPTDRRSSHKQILAQVLNYLKQRKVLLILDNFETFWEVSSNRRAAEDFLSQLGTLPNLALIVTLRGNQRPGNIRWVRVEPLQTLTYDAAKELLFVIMDSGYTSGDSEYIQKLLEAVAGIPLAVILIATLLRDDSESPKSLWHQWTRESARAIRVANEVDSDDRLYKLDISLRLSIFGPRMSNSAKEVLAAVSILPIGLNMDEDWLDSFQDLLGDTIRIRGCIRTLRDVALATLDPSTSPPRLRLLPPVRDFCLNHLPLDGELPRILIDIYFMDLFKYSDWGPSKNYTWVTMELSNISAILNFAITHCYISDDFGSAIYEYTEWRRFLCIPETDIVERAIKILSEHPRAKAKCLQALGYTLSETERVAEAIQLLEEALSIHRKLEENREVGWDLHILGSAYNRLNDFAHAEHYLSEARDLATEIDDNWIKGGILEALADVYLEQGKLPQAESAAKEALELCRASGSRQGEVNALWILGRVYHKQGNYDLAVGTLTAARDASQAIHDIRAEACANESLGYVYRDTEKPDQAALHFQSAISLFERAQDPTAAEDIRASLKRLQRSVETSNNT